MRSLPSIIAAGLCLLLAPSISNAATIYACKKKVGGTIRIVGAKKVCLATETKISWKSTGQIEVRDANNQFLGYPGISENLLYVFIPTLKKFMFFSEGTGTNIFLKDLVYQSTDCTGTAYIQTDKNSTSSILVENSGKTYAQTGTVITSLAVGSTYNAPECHVGSYTASLVIEAVEVTLPFTMPVAFPLKYE